jgi:hypothetical protein
VAVKTEAASTVSPMTRLILSPSLSSTYFSPFISLASLFHKAAAHAILHRRRRRHPTQASRSFPLSHISHFLLSWYLIGPKTVLGDGDDNAAGAPSHEVATLLLQLRPKPAWLTQCRPPDPPSLLYRWGDVHVALEWATG